MSRRLCALRKALIQLAQTAVNFNRMTPSGVDRTNIHRTKAQIKRARITALFLFFRGPDLSPMTGHESASRYRKGQLVPSGGGAGRSSSRAGRSHGSTSSSRSHGSSGSRGHGSSGSRRRRCSRSSGSSGWGGRVSRCRRGIVALAAGAQGQDGGQRGSAD